MSHDMKKQETDRKDLERENLRLQDLLDAHESWQDQALHDMMTFGGQFKLFEELINKFIYSTQVRNPETGALDHLYYGPAPELVNDWIKEIWDLD